MENATSSPPPFPDARLLAFVLALLLAAGETWTLQQIAPWNEPDYLPIALIFGLLFLFCCAEARAEARRADARLRPVLRVTHTMAMLFVYSLPMVAIFLMITPAWEPPTRWARAQELYLAASSTRTMMEERVIAGRPLAGIGKDIPTRAAGLVSSMTVSPDGVITVRSERVDATMVFTPRIEASADATPRLTWACKGEPRGIMPKQCR